MALTSFHRVEPALGLLEGSRTRVDVVFVDGFIEVAFMGLKSQAGLAHDGLVDLEALQIFMTESGAGSLQPDKRISKQVLGMRCMGFLGS